MTDTIIHSDLTFTQPFSHAVQQLLTPEAKQFLLELVTHFSAERERLLALRQQRQQHYDAGQLPDFDMETASIRESTWRIGAIPDDLLDSRV